jgi:cytochrome c553
MWVWIRRAVMLGLGLLPGMLAQAASPFEDSMAQRTLACTTCHGAQGQAGPDGYYPRLAGTPADYLYNQLLNIRTERRHYAPMVALLETLDDSYLRAIADYFSKLSVPYPPPAPTTLGAAELAHGRSLVLQGDPARGLPACNTCHGRQLMGQLPATPGLLGLPADYLNAQLGGWQSGQRHAAEPDCMAQVAKLLTARDTSAIAHWLAAQAVPAHAGVAERPVASGSANPAKAAPASPKRLHCGSDTAAAPPAQASVAERGAASSAAARGAYLARIGNCALCHSRPDGAAFAGGRALATPFGKVYASNLTPDAEHGIGRWSADDFWRALHHGVSQDGRALYPAFPYTSYTQLTRADSDALFAFLQTVPPSPQANRSHALRWPFKTQWALKVWRALFFTPADAQATTAPTAMAPAQQATWLRGRYLVQGLGHCMECHGTRNALGALSHSIDQVGSVLPGTQWFAPSLFDAGGASVAGWSEADTREFLQTGRNRRAQASGPMAEVVLHSTQYLTDADAQAMAVFLRTLPQTAPQPGKPAPERASAQALQLGAHLYETHCADCHGAQGQGQAGAYPALAGNRAVTQVPPNNLINSVLRGGFGAATAGHARPYGMPPFALRLSDAELAALLSFVRSSWGNQASALSALEINRYRDIRPP